MVDKHTKKRSALGKNAASAAEPNSKRARKLQGADQAASGTFMHSWKEEKENATNFKKGSWTPEEDGALIRYYGEFCANNYGLVTEEEKLKPILEPTRGTNLAGFWVRFAQYFQFRTVRSVFKRAYRLLHPGNYGGKWTEENFAELERLVARHGHKWKEIGLKMNRLPNSCRNQYLRVCAKTFGKGRWTPDEVAKLTELVKKYSTRVGNSQYVGIAWRAIEEEMTSRSADQCMQKWYSSFGAQATGHPWTAAADAALVDSVIEDGAEDWADVLWDDLEDVVHSGPACRQRLRTLSKLLPACPDSSFSGMLEQLQEYYANLLQDDDESVADNEVMGLSNGSPETEQIITNKDEDHAKNVDTVSAKNKKSKTQSKKSDEQLQVSNKKSKKQEKPSSEENKESKEVEEKSTNQEKKSKNQGKKSSKQIRDPKEVEEKSAKQEKKSEQQEKKSSEQKLEMEEVEEKPKKKAKKSKKQGKISSEQKKEKEEVEEKSTKQEKKSKKQGKKSSEQKKEPKEKEQKSKKQDKKSKNKDSKSAKQDKISQDLKSSDNPYDEVQLGSGAGHLSDSSVEAKQIAEYSMEIAQQVSHDLSTVSQSHGAEDGTLVKSKGTTKRNKTASKKACSPSDVSKQSTKKRKPTETHKSDTTNQKSSRRRK